MPARKSGTVRLSNQLAIRNLQGVGSPAGFAAQRGLTVLDPAHYANAGRMRHAPGWWPSRPSANIPDLDDFLTRSTRSTPNNALSHLRAILAL